MTGVDHVCSIVLQLWNSRGELFQDFGLPRALIDLEQIDIFIFLIYKFVTTASWYKGSSVPGRFRRAHEVDLVGNMEALVRCPSGTNATETDVACRTSTKRSLKSNVKLEASRRWTSSSTKSSFVFSMVMPRKRTGTDNIMLSVNGAPFLSIDLCCI